jgi:hypothetical protein
MTCYLPDEGIGWTRGVRCRSSFAVATNLRIRCSRTLLILRKPLRSQPNVPFARCSITVYGSRHGCACGIFSSKSPIITPSGSWNIANVPTPGIGIGSTTVFPPSSSALSRLARRSATLT